jgi:hypothetical protein
VQGQACFEEARRSFGRRPLELLRVWRSAAHAHARAVEQHDAGRLGDVEDRLGEPVGAGDRADHRAFLAECRAGVVSRGRPCRSRVPGPRSRAPCRTAVSARGRPSHARDGAFASRSSGWHLRPAFFSSVSYLTLTDGFPNDTAERGRMTRPCGKCRFPRGPPMLGGRIHR